MWGKVGGHGGGEVSWGAWGVLVAGGSGLDGGFGSAVRGDDEEGQEYVGGK